MNFYGRCGEKIVRLEDTDNLISHKKGYIHFHRQRGPSQEGLDSPKTGFRCFLGKYSIF